jgi:hypothetical protein
MVGRYRRSQRSWYLFSRLHSVTSQYSHCHHDLKTHVTNRVHCWCSLFLAYFPYFGTNKSRFMRSRYCLCLYLYPPPPPSSDPICMKLGMCVCGVCIQSISPFQWHILHKSISLVLCVCISIPLSLLGNDYVKTLLRQQIHNNRRIFGHLMLYVVHVVSKDSRRLVLPRTCYCYLVSKFTTCWYIFCFNI